MRVVFFTLKRERFMKLPILSRVAYLSLICLLITVLSYSAVIIVRTAREHESYSERERDYQEKAAAAQKEVKSKEEHLHRMQSDSKYLEDVIRMRLGYARSNEYIFHFESK
jgi:cell division protein FtsB